MAVNKMMYTGANSDNGPSPSIWADCPILGMIEDPNVGYHFFDDFMTSWTLAAGSSLTILGPYNGIADTGASLAGERDTTATAASGLGGAQQLVAGTTADADCILQLGAGTPFAISDAAADAKKLWFEARFKISTIANDVSSFFVGLADSLRVVNAGIFTTTQGATVDSAVADVAMLGFWRPDADGSGLSAMYGANGQTASEIISDMDTLVADTFVKAGFVYDPLADTSKRIKFFSDGVEQSTYVTGALIAAAAFPDAEGMTPTIAVANDDGSTASTLTLDWWRCAQLR